MIDDPGDEEYLDGGSIEDCEDSTKASRPAEHGGTRYDAKSVDDAVTLIIIRLRKRRVPFHVIASILNRSQTTVFDRYKAVPFAKRAYYEKAEI